VTLDTVPLPRKISSFLPRVSFLHLAIPDLPDEDLLTHVPSAVDFVSSGQESGVVLVHCLRGRSRSAALVLAHVMRKYKYDFDKAHGKVKARRPCILPCESFVHQLKLFEAMGYALDEDNVQYRMYRLRLASERMRKAKVLFRDDLDCLLDADPAEEDASIRKNASQAYKCKRCRRTLATSSSLMPHVVREEPDWTDPKWSLPREEILEGAADCGLDLCPRSLFVNPTTWMREEVRAKLGGALYCPGCGAKVGAFSWVTGSSCAGCGANVKPSFQLDLTEIVFKTASRHLQATGREPVLV